MEKCLTTKQVADRLGLSPDVVRTHFRRQPGVIVIGDGPRKTIRIPESVLAAWVEARRVRAARG